jgi:hypothetical protein
MSVVAVATKYFTVAPNICGSSVCDLLLVALVARRILMWLLDFLENVCISDFIVCNV